MNTLSIIIPTYNEEKTISKVIESIETVFKDAPHEIIVVDDGSTDQTKTICASHKNIKYLRLDKNSGKGKALRVGLTYATGTFVAIQDADLEYHPAILEEIYHQARENIAIYGRRDRKQGYFWNRVGNILISWFCNFLYGSRLFDIYTCYKIIPLKILKSLKLSAEGFEIEAEITAKLLRANIGIVEIPIAYSPRTFQDGKHIRARDGFIGIWTLLKNRF
jgi:glycosyltransferase involved in cell wall biosynthesis